MHWLGPFLILILGLVTTSHVWAAQIAVPEDAPPPRTPEQSAARVSIPPGFRLELVASEPLVREPSGLCWDEHGRLYVSELHGYNLEGQYDIDELNKSGELDRVVRRVQANEEAKQKAQAGTYGVVKRLEDTDGDGRMDRVTVLADDLPPCYGLAPARGGVIVACAPHIMFLADRDGDGRAEVRETLFTGFQTGVLERGINAPRWGLDVWIYFGKGHSGGTITGPHLEEPFAMGGSNFRIRPDGSAIEMITGRTATFGHALTAEGDYFVITTSRPGLFVTPLPWSYLARNASVAAPESEHDAGGYTRVFPTSQPHPWRIKRSEDPGFYKYYRDRYGPGDSDAGGYFTSGCSPLVYQDVAFPEAYRGSYFMCEPAANLIHNARIEREGPRLRLRRPPGMEEKEFLASQDIWFHPMNLQHGPEGALYIVDFYREIIEDYSAVPRFLQQQYGLTNGIAHGRIWRLTHRDAPAAPSPDMSRLDARELAREVGSPHFWRRQTARRLLVERKDVSVADQLAAGARRWSDLEGVLNALYTLYGLGRLTADVISAALSHPSPAVRRHALRLSEPFLDTHRELLAQVIGVSSDAALADEVEGGVILQYALTLGASRDPLVVPVLALLAMRHGDVPWMSNAILSSVSERAGALLGVLLVDPERLGAATGLLEPLCASIVARGDANELGTAIARIGAKDGAAWQVSCLRGLQVRDGERIKVALSTEGSEALNRLLVAEDAEVRRLAASLLEAFQVADPVQRGRMVAQAARDAADVTLPVERRLAAVTQLAHAGEPEATPGLLAAWPVNTPQVQSAILDAVFQRRDRLGDLLDAIEQQRIPVSALNAFQRLTLTEHDQPGIRERAAGVLGRATGPDQATMERFAAALSGDRNRAHGEQVFREHCATCHRLREIGFEVGPDLGAEFQRADEAILRDILAPNDVLSAGYPTFLIETRDGQSFNGILADETATSLTLRQAAGLERVFLRKDIESFSTLAVSLMSEALVETLTPRDVADVIAWVKGSAAAAERGSNPVVLFDDEPGFAGRLKEGGGTAVIKNGGAASGRAYLVITPSQRYAVRIPGWDYRIVEKPEPGEYRYLRLAWRSRGGEGVMVELAAEGSWPRPEDARRRYYAGRNTTEWKALEVSPMTPEEWRVITLDLWKDCGAFTLTGIAPTAMGGEAHFDRIELLRDLRSLTEE